MEFDFQKANKGRCQRESTCRECYKVVSRRKRRTQNGFINHLLASCKKSAKLRKSRGRTNCGEFTLTKKDILELKERQGNKCVLSNVDLIWCSGAGWQKASIDRIDNNQGYTRSNIQLVAWGINQAKSDYSLQEFLAICSAVAKHNGLTEVTPAIKNHHKRICKKCGREIGYRKRYCSYCPKKHDTSNTCIDCKSPIYKTSLRCPCCASKISNMPRRKVSTRPSLEQLRKEVLETSYLAVGKKYGVSDNAVRKWFRAYGVDPPKKHKKSIRFR
jgi:RNA polymerase-binding transcription factor DksA